ncbi:MAG: SIMPL domain-containing protein [Anaerolineae bacterium]|nr:SIMPL domain-containing protein [Anaerolineae bacterium]
MLIGSTRKIGLLALAALVLAVGFNTFGMRTQAQETDSVSDHTITVSGVGEVYGTPDTVYISLGVDQTSPSVTEAVTGARATLANIISALEGAGVNRDDIQTSNFNVFPEDRFDSASGQPTGERTYHAVLGVNVIVRTVDNAGEIITTALDAGANSINGLSFGIADTTELEAQARQAAVADAKARADQLAEAFGVSVGNVVAISEGISGGSSPVPVMRDMAVGMGGASNIVPGQLSVRVQVNASFDIGS